MDGFAWREKRHRELMAWQIAWTIAPLTKNPPTPQKILGEEQSPQDKAQALDDVWAALERKRGDNSR